MIAITLGYRAKGPTAPFEVLYAGPDASAADAASLNPPAGIIRTALIKHPIVSRWRHYEAPAAPAPTDLTLDADDLPKKPSPKK